MNTLWMLLIGGIIGSVAGYLTSRDLPMGIIGNIIAGLLGSWLGERFLGTWGPEVAGMAIFPSIVGAVVLVLLTSLVVSSMKK
jgi:uncharacterized membrane protein YeaQ/YmgE (transglycosylase-associated protein family)